MAFDKGTAARLESLYQQYLEEAFQRPLTFEFITVEPTQNMFDQDALHVTVAYDGDSRLMDPAKLNRISSLMVDRAAELGIENTLIESYMLSLEYTHGMTMVEEPLSKISGNQDWHGMLNIARLLLETGSAPTKAELATAVDRTYFAAYHALCHSNAQTFAGNLRARRRDDWSRVYMAMDENSIVDRLRQHRHQASDKVQDFGAAFAILQEQQHRANERLESTFQPSEVARIVQRAGSAITALETLNNEDHLSLAINLLVGKMRGRNPAAAHP